MATNLQFIPGRKQGSENPILNGFRYVFDKRSNDTSYWKCSEFRKGCRARIRTVDRQLITPTPDHTHPVHHAETTVHVSKQNLKRKASGGDQPTKYLVSEAVGGLGYESRAKLGCQLSSLNRMVQRSRKAANRHPSNPRDLETLSIPANYILSTDNEPMMLWDSGWDERTRRSFLWGTPKNADHMVDAEHWVVDGTFKSAPNLFHQLFTVHGLFPDGWHLPLFYGLLPGKTTTLYRNLFEEIDTWASGGYQPQSILMDYELAIHNAVASVWPSTTRRGCNFHYKKALLKHVKQTNIWEEYLTPNSPVRDFFAMTGAIAYVPETDVPRIWRHLKPLLPIDMAEFASYYENTWIGTSTTNPNFAPHMWNQHEAAQMRIPRSSNIAEGWHHGFHSMLSCSKPTIWKFLDCLKAPKWIRYDRQLQRIVDDYDNYSNPMDFLKAIGNLTML